MEEKSKYVKKKKIGCLCYNIGSFSPRPAGTIFENGKMILNTDKIFLYIKRTDLF